MASRNEATDSLDFFPTPPWATRALMTHVLSESYWRGKTCWEPACGEGHMSEVLKDCFQEVISSDIATYGYSEALEIDFLDPRHDFLVDWIITNPPFNLAEKFAARRNGRAMAMLVRTAWLEGAGRYQRLFSVDPPSIVAQFTERVTMVKGRIAEKGVSSATAFCWVVWTQEHAHRTLLRWIPPCKKDLSS